MGNEKHGPRNESTPQPPPAAGEERPSDELKPVITTPGGRFWDIELPPETEAALRVSGF